MKANLYESQYDNKSNPKANMKNRGSSTSHIGLTLLILLMFCSSCTPRNPTPASSPSNANGQAILGWGGNSNGQIGDGSTLQRLVPSLISMKNIQAIAAGGDFSLALTSDGRVLEWGGRNPTPTEAPGLSMIKQIAVGDRHRLALRQDGTVIAWGVNDHGQLGDGSNSSRTSPVQVVGLNKILVIAAGGDHSLAIKSDFSIVSWGDNLKGQLGDGTTTDRSMPVAVPGITAIEIATSSNHTIALTTDLKILGWGSNKECQLGKTVLSSSHGPITRCPNHLSPIEVPLHVLPSSQGNAIAATDSITFVVSSKGKVFGIGGDGDPKPNRYRGICSKELNSEEIEKTKEIFVELAIKQNVVKVAAGKNHALFLTDNGYVLGLGENLSGQVGRGSASVQECVYAISSTIVRGASQIAAGKEHSLALINGSLTYTTRKVDFGNHPFGMGLPSQQEIMISNDGLVPVTFYDISLSNLRDYFFTENCPDLPASLAPNEVCTIKISFAPAAYGRSDGYINLIHDGQGRQQNITLTGNGTEAKVEFSVTEIDFGEQQINTLSVPKVVTITNTGLAPLEIKSILPTAGFKVDNNYSGDCLSGQIQVLVSPGDTCTFHVIFAPTVLGKAVGNIEVVYAPNGVNQPALIQLKGNGIP